MAPQSNLSDRLKAFADRFAALGRPSRPGGGYSGLAGGGLGSDGLGAPLVGGGSGHSEGGGGGGGYYSTGAAPPPSSRYDPPQTASAHHHHQHQQQSYGSVDVAGGGDAGAGAAVNLPTQVRGERWCFFYGGREEREHPPFVVPLSSLLGHLSLYPLPQITSLSHKLASREEKRGVRGRERAAKKGADETVFVGRDGASSSQSIQTSFSSSASTL